MIIELNFSTRGTVWDLFSWSDSFLNKTLGEGFQTGLNYFNISYHSFWFLLKSGIREFSKKNIQENHKQAEADN